MKRSKISNPFGHANHYTVKHLSFRKKKIARKIARKSRAYNARHCR